MEIIIGLRPACRASLLHRHTPIRPTFRFPPPNDIVDLLSSANGVLPGVRSFRCSQFHGENAYG